MTTVSIPLVTLPVGSQTFGPSPIADTDTKITLSIDRTVSGGLNSQPSTTQIMLTTFQSDDGGATFQELAAVSVVGGIFTKGGNQINTDHIITELNPGTSRQVQATVTVTGASVAVAGSIATS